MGTRIDEIVAKIQALNDDLRREQVKLWEKYGFYFRGKKVIFLEKFKDRNKLFRVPAWKYAIPQHIRHLLSLPFIYMMIVPVLLLDGFLTLYNLTAMPLYRIPRVKRKDHIVYDRQFLGYLNIIQKVNCLYCTYVNGVFSYASELGARTERYWCPIKAAHKARKIPDWYNDYADYGNPEEWSKKFNDCKAIQDKIRSKERKSLG